MALGEFTRFLSGRSPIGWLLDAGRGQGREREAVVQAAKMAGAAAAAWAIARRVDDSMAVLAPYTAAFMVSETIIGSMRGAAQQLLAIVLGLLLAYAAVESSPSATMAMAVVVLVGMMVGQWHRLGESGVWVAMTALLMVGYGVADEPEHLLRRVAECGFGAFVGVAVNTLIAPPLHVRQSDEAVRRLAGEIAEHLEALCEGIAGGWHVDDARAWLQQARKLESTSRRAEESARHLREGARFNPRWKLGSNEDPQRYEAAVTALHEVARQVQHMGEALAWLDSSSDTSIPIEPAISSDFEELLAGIANVVRHHSDLMHGDPQLGRQLGELLDASRSQYRSLDQRVRESSGDLDESWSAEGALLLAAHRAAWALSAGPERDEHG